MHFFPSHKKVKKTGFVFLLFGLSLFTSVSSTAQVIDCSTLHTALAESKTDSIRRIEQMAAHKFQKLINGYRVSKGLHALAWNDTVWAAARNHSTWMSSHNNLSHEENRGKNFTGKDPGDRYTYVSKGKGTLSWCGENVAYNWISSPVTADSIAASMAAEAFDQWKHSPGHNANMLRKNATAHGVAFILDGDRFWATDLFVY